MLFLNLVFFLLQMSELSYAGLPNFRKLPSFLKTCKRSDPNLKKCLITSIEKLRPYLVKGIPEFGIPPCEPFLVPEIHIKQGRGPALIESTYSNVHVTGASQFLLKDIEVNLDQNYISFKLWLPFLHMISDYDLDGKILMFPIYGEGVCEGNYTDINASVMIEGEKYNKRDHTFFHVNKFNVKFDVQRATVSLSNLFDGDTELGNAMNSFMNDNSDVILQEIKPILEESIASMFKIYTNNIFHKYSLEVLLPP